MAGYFIENDEVDQYVLIQAPSKEAFQHIASKITEDHSEWCECCGERWSIYYVDGTPEPLIYGTNVYEAKAEWYRERAILYHFDGRVERIHFAK